MSLEHIKRLVSRWPPEWQEAYEERVCIMLADDIPLLDAVVAAFACVGAEMERKQ